MKRYAPAAALLLLLAFPAAPAEAQQADRFPIRHEVFAGSEIESYLRYLNTLESEPYPWTIRGLGPKEVERVLPEQEVHPWMHRYDLDPDAERPRLEVEIVSPEAGVVYNTAFPEGRNDGALWAGRGATGWVSGGVAARYGPVSLVLAPVAFLAENREFELFPNGRTDSLRYGAWQVPETIDLPQRFGEGAYGILDPGQSTLRFEALGVGAGISTANQIWGPASDHAVILGDNAGGFPHAFLGTSTPADLWLTKVHGRIVWGRLEQSAFSPMPDGSSRLMSGLVVSLSPRGLQGLEVGFSRFFHDFWPAGGPTFGDLLRPFEGFIKEGLEETPDEARGNQLVSVFARWAVPGTGFELYGEYGREDHSWSLRHLALEPDDIGAYVLGFRKAWLRRDGIVVGVRGETYSSETSHLELTDLARGQSPMYRHTRQRQGHTHRGQLLASAAGFGGAGSVLGLDLHHALGRWTFEWERTLRAFERRYAGDGVPDLSGRDVLQSARVESELFRGPLALIGGVEIGYGFNRNLQEDDINLQTQLTLRARF